MRRKKRATFNYKFLFVSLLFIAVLVYFGENLTDKKKTQTSNVLGSLFARGGDDSDDSSGSSGSGSSGNGSSGSGSSESGEDDNDDSSGSSGGAEDSNSGGSNTGSSGSSTTTSGAINTIRQFFSPQTPSPTGLELEDEDEDEDEDGEDETGIRTEIEDDQTEIRLSETERIRVRTKDGRTRIDITSGGVKTRFEFRDDRVVIKAEQEDGTEVELEDADDTLLKIEERLADSDIKIATDAANRIIIQRGDTGAVSQFPISIDLATNTLVVNTPSGQKEVIALPDQVVHNLLVTNVINRLGSGVVVSSLQSGEISTLAQIITLGENSGIPIYEISGISDQKLIGFIPVTIEKTVEVSAETGEVLSTQVSTLDRFLDLFSF